MSLDLHWAMADPSDLDDDPADTVTASANAECQHARTDRDSTRCPDCDAELVYEVK